jgi:hypothetical protein
MPAAAVEAAFQARQFASMPTVPIIPAIVSGEVPKDYDAWIEIQYPVANGIKPALGRHYFEEGAARLVLNVRRSMEMEDALSIADDIASVYRDITFDGVETFTPSPPIINDTTNDGNWFSLSVIVPYRYQFDD